ncbi:hypothetical protein ABL78_2780 [Leptomonas seymouri]|uniref:Uncharacterized protein n=1 Tax=Leptomonas seymouri TaxID=5684 RepID=A0A0N0P7C0_LEPSE|nr:hypothetical protein ABL78_2780 [Leptomonas seymouri]|eukprot:KPI88147.1 hypothetical protein ABL78_2780 [Leptomonas seymouri]
MLTHNDIAASAQEGRTHAGLYPRVMPYTRTTAFMVVPAASAQVITPRAAATSAHSMLRPKPLGASASMSCNQLSYLADPSLFCTSQSTEDAQGPPHELTRRHRDTQPSPHIVGPLFHGHGTHPTPREKHGGDHRYKERQRYHSVPSHEEALRDPYDKYACGASRGLPANERLKGAGRSETCFVLGPAALFSSVYTQHISDHPAPLSEKVDAAEAMKWGIHTQTLALLHARAPPRHCGRQAQRETLGQHPVNTFRSRLVRSTSRPVHAASSVHPATLENACDTQQQRSPLVVRLLAGDEEVSSERSLSTAAAVGSAHASAATHGGATQRAFLSKEGAVHAPKCHSSKEVWGIQRLPDAQTHQRSPSLKDSHHRGARTNAVWEGEGGQDAYQAGEGHTCEEQHAALDSSGTSDNAALVDECKRQCSESCTDNPPVPALASPSPQLPVCPLENDASAAAPTDGFHESGWSTHHHTNCSALDETVVSALSPSPQKSSPIQDDAQHALETVNQISDDFVVAPPPASSQPPLRAGYPLGEQQLDSIIRNSSSSPAVLHSVSSASMSGEVSSPSQPRRRASMSVSLPLRCRLSFGTAVGADEDDEGDEETSGNHGKGPQAQEPSLVLLSSSFGRHCDPLTPSLLPIASEATPTLQERAWAQRFPLVLQLEAAAREWIEVDASVQLHHLACEERICYRGAEVARYRRRLQEVVSYPTVSIPNPDDLITPPTNRQGDPEEVLSRAGISEATMLLTSSRFSGRGYRRMPSASSLPPLSPQGKAAPAEEDLESACANEEASMGCAASLSSPSASPRDAASFSPLPVPVSYRSTDGDCLAEAELLCRHSPPHSPMKKEEYFHGSIPASEGVLAAEAEPFGSRFAGTVHDDIPDNSGDNAEWEDASDAEGEEEEGDNAADSLKESGSALVLPDRGAYATVSSVIETADEALVPAFSFSQTHHHNQAPKDTCCTTWRPPSLLRSSPPTPHVFHLLQDLQNDEEDARYLLTGECPPPHVFQRWADRFQLDQQHAADPAAAAGVGLQQRRGLTPSLEAMEPTKQGGERQPTGRCGVGVLEGSYNQELKNGRRSLEPPESLAVITTVKEINEMALAEGPAESSLRDGSQSTSRQRLCSERNRAWMMENFLEDFDEGGDTANPSNERGSSGSPEEDGAYAEAEYNATGRYAPDPLIFDEEKLALRGPSPLLSPPVGPDDASPAFLFPPDTEGPSAIDPLTFPERSSTERVPYTGAETAVALLTVPSDVAFEPLSYPSEETYEAPFGSERDAWQMLIDDFIEGLVRLMGDEV